MSSITQNYKAAFDILKKKPVLLWGLSLLSNFIIIVVTLFGGIPLLTVPIALVLQASLSVLYLKGVRGEGVETKNIFSGFTSLKQAVHVAGGMLWMILWVVLWCLIPVVGIVFGIIKAIEYAFTPYILITRPEIEAMDALKESKKMTKGLKGKMFGAKALVVVAIYIVVLILALFARIPFIGSLFGVILLLFIVAVVAFCPIFLGLVDAKFYEDALHPAPQPMPQPQPIPQSQPQFNFDPYTGQPIQQVQPQFQYGQPQPTPQPAPAPAAQPAPEAQPTPAPETPVDDNQPTRI
ncbi:MAG: hypothetical protein LUE20_00075 [Oscillospiraceae bacterium]|nr:hypothetical protein [Oscillospiraceae bacterium]